MNALVTLTFACHDYDRILVILYRVKPTGFNSVGERRLGCTNEHRTVASQGTQME